MNYDFDRHVVELIHRRIAHHQEQISGFALHHGRVSCIQGKLAHAECMLWSSNYISLQM